MRPAPRHRARGPRADRRQAGAVPRGAAAQAADLRGGLPRHRGEGAPRRGRCARGRAVLHGRAARSGGGVRGQAQRRPAARAARRVEAGGPRPGLREEDAPAGCRRARRGAGRAVPGVRAARRRDRRAAGRGRRRRPKSVILPADPPRPAAPILAPPGPLPAPRASNPNPCCGESRQWGPWRRGHAHFCTTRRPAINTVYHSSPSPRAREKPPQNRDLLHGPALSNFKKLFLPPCCDAVPVHDGPIAPLSALDILSISAASFVVSSCFFI